MNNVKVGPVSGIPYRMVQGIVRGLAEYVKIVEKIHVTHIRRRTIRIKPSILEIGFGDHNDSMEPITLIVDASGLIVSKKGHYIEQMDTKEKGIVKLHMAVDAKSKKVDSFRITKGTVHDAKKFCPLVREAAEKYDIEKLHADKANDNRRKR